MKLFTPLNTSAKRGRKARAPSRTPLLFAIVVAGLVMLICLARIHFERRTMQMGLDWEAHHKEYSALLKERDNLLMEREGLSDGRYIISRARQMDLAAPLPGQRRRMPAPAPALAARDSQRD